MELDLQVEFTMRQIRMKYEVPGSIITSPDGKPQVKVMDLLELFALQRNSFIAALKKEQDEIARAQQAAQAGTGQVAAKADDRQTGPAVPADVKGD